MSDPASNQHPSADGGHPDAADTTYPGKGMRIGEYVIIDTLGHGSMATVYLARDATGHEVALKVFQEGPGVSPTMLERFKREAEASKKLRRHPNIMKVYATGQDAPYHYIVMEPIRNSRTLEDLLEVNPLPVDELVSLAAKIARALHYAHSRNIVHRDVKPSNIMIDEFGEPLLTDFGVAALIDWPSCTLSGALTGTPLYMSPEQSRADRVGPASDIYSLAVVLYEGLTGMLPYSTQHSAPVKNVLEAVRNETPRRPRLYRKDISADLEAVVLKALDKDPARRYEDAEAFASDLERARSGRHVSARMVSSWEHVRGLLRRYDQFFVAAAVMLAMALGAGFYFRQKLMTARYEKLLAAVHLRNFVLRLTQEDPDNAESSQPPGAWHEIRLARRAMSTGNWTGARNGFAAAADLARALGDTRTAALAVLDLARCDSMLGNFDDALARYRDVLRNPDASPQVADLAQFEGLLLALLKGDRAEAVQLLGHRALPGDGPIRDAINCLAGDTTTRALAQRIDSMPQRLRNDAHLALAVRYRMDGDEKNYATQLRRSMQSSSPTSDWPAPLAKLLLNDVRG
jgi:serine/threonine protein kinase